MPRKRKKTINYTKDVERAPESPVPARPVKRAESDWHMPSAHDSRKPQLHQRPNPLSALERRASSAARPKVELDTTAPQVPLRRASKSNRALDEKPRAPWAVFLIASCVSLLVFALLPGPTSQSPLSAMMGLSDAPLTLSLTAFGVVIAALSLLLGLVQRGVKLGASDSMLPNFPLMLGALIATLAVSLFEASQHAGQPLRPMRGALLGVPLSAWVGLCVGALLALREQTKTGLTLRALAFGLLGLILFGWTPIGYTAGTHFPLSLALWGDASPASAAIHTGPWVEHRAATLLLCALPLPAVIALGPWKINRERWLLGAVAATASLGVLVPVLSMPASSDALSALSMGLVQLGCVGAVSVATGASLDRLTRRWDDENLVLVEWLVALAILTVWGVAKSNGMGLSATDEGIYFYAANAWTQGVWPYHDYFFSHPPLHILGPAALFAAFGFSVPLAKSIAVVATGVAGLFVWRIGRRWFHPTLGLIAMGLFLFAGEPLKSSANMTGINLTTMWAVAGLWAALRGSRFRAGALLGMAACTGFYAIGYLVMLLPLTALCAVPKAPGRQSTATRLLAQPGFRLALGFIFVFGVTHLVFDLLGGEAYVRGVYRYHFLKKAKIAGFTPLSEGLHALPSNLLLMLKGHDFRVTLYYHGLQIGLAMLAPVGLAMSLWLNRREPKTPWHHWLWNPRVWWRQRKTGGALMLLWTLAWGLLTEFGQFKERYDFYYTLVLPPICLLAVAWLHTLWQLVERSLHVDDVEGARSRAKVRVLAATALILTTLWVPLSLWANNSAWPSETAQTGSSRGAGEVLHFAWSEAPGPAFLSELTRDVLWKEHRVRGSLETGLHHYLWSKKRTFSTAPVIADYIRDHSGPHETMTGASTFAPMVALLAQRRMAADHVDTNSKTFKTGVVTPPEFWKRACADNLRYILAAPRSYFSASAMRRREVIRQQFRLVKTFRDPSLKHWRDVTLELWERKDLSKPCEFIAGRPRR